jgi:hypothetical protein
MQFSKIFVLFLLLVNFEYSYAQNRLYQAVQPFGDVGASGQKTSVILAPVNANTSFFDPSKKMKDGTDYFSFENKSLYQIKEIKTSDSSADFADLRTLIQRQKLLMEEKDVKNCIRTKGYISANGYIECYFTSEVPVFKSGDYDFQDSYMESMKVANKPTPSVPMSKKELTRLNARTVPKDEAYVSTLNSKISEVNKTLNERTSFLTNCKKGYYVPSSQPGDSKLLCALKKAQKAYSEGKNSGKIQKDVFILNDFSSGAVMGKMWFLHADGTPANVAQKNPIEVSRGDGGFGRGRGSLRTPNGALVTKAYNPPRSGRIKDGIELEGLEAENADVHDRGVLLHGWDPRNPTAGCLGVSGTLTLGNQRDVLGTPPPYLDSLKQGILKGGGVMIYNFTPSKAKECGF